MNKRSIALLSFGAISATAPYTLVSWPFLFFFTAPMFYLLYLDGRHRIFQEYHYVLAAFIGAAIVVVPSLYYSLPVYIIGLFLGTICYSSVYLLSRLIIRRLNGSGLVIFVPAFVWTVICLLFDFRSMVSAILDVGVMMPFTAPLIWYVGSLGITFLLILFNSALAHFLVKKTAIFTKVDGIKKSAGEIAKDVAKGALVSAACILIGVIYIPIPQTAATMMHFAVVDANDGAILWYHNNIPNQGWDPENQKQLALLVRSVVGPFPDSLFKKKNIKEKISKKEQPVSGAPETKGAAVVATAGAN